MGDYGSIREWIEHEFLLPYLYIGGTRSDFWGLTPKSIQIDFEAYTRREKAESIKIWEIGAYVKSALASSILVCSLANRDSINNMPEYPPMPNLDDFSPENAENEKENKLKKERERAYLFFKNLKA